MLLVNHFFKLLLLFLVLTGPRRSWVGAFLYRGLLFEDDGAFKRWSLVGGYYITEGIELSGNEPQCLIHSLFCFMVTRWRVHSNYSPDILNYLTCPKTTETTDHRLKPPKQWANKLLCLSFGSGIWETISQFLHS